MIVGVPNCPLFSTLMSNQSSPSSSSSSSVSSSLHSPSPDPIQFSVIDLSRLYPVTKLPIALPPDQTTSITQAGRIGRWFTPFEETTKHAIAPFHVPSQYLNAFALISSKIRWLQLVTGWLMRLDHTSGEDLNTSQLLPMTVDGIRRNLVFHIKVQ